MESVSNIVKKLMVEEPYYGLFASGITRAWSTQVDRMGIVPDGLNYKLLINKTYWESLSKQKRVGLLKHNLLHMCFFHVTDEDIFKPYANSTAIMQLAMDLEVNGYLYDEQVPDDGASEIFKKLPNLPKRQGTRYYIDVLNKIMDGSPEAHQWGNGTEGVREILTHPDRDHDSWGPGNGQTITLMRAQLEYRMRTAAESARQNIPQELTNIIAGLLTFKKPIFNWKKYFRNFLANAYDSIPKSTRRKESTRFAGAIGHKMSKKHVILVGVDTSGSIGQKELDEFFSEIYHVWKSGADVDIVEFDTRVQQQYHYKGKTPIEVQGRGGTDFRPFVDYYNANRKKYSVGICFTDGYASLHEINPYGNFSWVISADGDHEQKYPGYTIHIPKIIE